MISVHVDDMTSEIQSFWKTFLATIPVELGTDQAH